MPVQQDGVSNDFLRLGAWVYVVIHIQDAIWCEQPAAALKQGLGMFGRQVTIEARRDDVVELALFRLQAVVALRQQRDIGQTQRGRHLLALPNSGFRGVNADELGLWVGQGKGEQAFTGAAAQAEHPRSFQRWRCHSI
ncbi:hypothetical protein D3C86_1720270 [compost metagenome]